jgi:hypothetical protein
MVSGLRNFLGIRGGQQKYLGVFGSLGAIWGFGSSGTWIRTSRSEKESIEGESTISFSKQTKTKRKRKHKS